MPRETIARILDIEEQATQVTADAQQQAEQMMTKARKLAEDERERVLTEAHEQADRIIARGQETATQEREALLSNAKQEVARMERLAEDRFDPAIQFVLNQVVESARI